MNFKQLTDELMATETFDTKASEFWKNGDYVGYHAQYDVKKKVVAKLMEGSGITITHDGGCNLGRCYNAYYYKIVSSEPIPNELFRALRKAGQLGYGQGCNFDPSKQQEDGTFVARATDTVDSSD